jgi:hypothetical protein
MRNKYTKKPDVVELNPEPEPEPEDIIIPINQANTLLFSGDDGTTHILDIQRFILDFSIQPAIDQTKRANYFPTRRVIVDKNGLFSNKEEVVDELKQNEKDFIVTEELTKISEIYHHYWNNFDDALTMLSIVEIPKKLVIT